MIDHEHSPGTHQPRALKQHLFHVRAVVKGRIEGHDICEA